MQASATKLKDLHDWLGDAALYVLNPPLADDDGTMHSHVVVSAVMAWGSGPETYIFPADSDGNVSSFGEMTGSLRGTLDHAAALGGAGYVIADEVAA